MQQFNDLERLRMKFTEKKSAAETILFVYAFLFLTIACQAGEGTLRSEENTSANCGIVILKDGEFYASLMESVKTAEKEIKIGTFIFLVRINKTNPVKKLADELIKAHKRGVDVEIFLEAGKGDLTPDNLASADYLKKSGIKVFIDHDNEKNHFKLAVIDRKKVYIGSHNISSSALKYNKEISVLIESEEAAKECLSYLGSITYIKYE